MRITNQAHLPPEVMSVSEWANTVFRKASAFISSVRPLPDACDPKVMRLSWSPDKDYNGNAAGACSCGAICLCVSCCICEWLHSEFKVVFP
jgi:hypothetical protein